jgi:TetR/AcrR family transcriptional regulator, cholesterol catabolism regulator
MGAGSTSQLDNGEVLGIYGSEHVSNRPQTESMARKILRPAKKQSLLIRDPQLRQHKREEVAAAALEVFLKEGFHRATTREIARRAGISQGSIFTYFKDKEEILFHIFSRQHERAVERILAVLSQQLAEATCADTDPEQVFVDVFATLLRTVDEQRRFILLVYQETKSLTQHARQALIAGEKRLQALLSEAICYGVERGRFAPDQIELKAHNLLALAHIWAIRHWAYAGVLNTVEDYIAFLQPQVLAMLETRTAAVTPKIARPPVPTERPELA